MTYAVDRTIAPDIQPINRFHLPQVETVSFSNGNTLHHIALGSQPVVRIEWIFNAGSRIEEKTGTSFFMAKMVSEGTAQLSASEIQERLARYGAFLEVNPSADQLNITLYSLSRYLKDLIPFVKNLLTGSTFPETEFEKLRHIQKQILVVNLEKTSYTASVKFREVLYGAAHPYGKQMNAASIEQLQPSDLVSFFQKYFNQKPCDIIISGGFDTTAIDLLKTTFGVDSLQPAQTKAALPATTASARETVLEKEGSVQSSLRYGRLLFNHTHPDYFDAYILNEILGGYFGSRLMQNIREEKGYTYGIHSSIVSLKEGGYFVIGTDVKREFTRHTIEEIEKELNGLIQEPVGENELQTVKSYMLGSFVGDIQTPFSVADKFKTIYFNGLGYDYYDRFFERIKTITASDLQTVASRYFQPAHMSYVVAGGF